jgi:hypothetical protein
MALKHQGTLLQAYINPWYRDLWDLFSCISQLSHYKQQLHPREISPPILVSNITQAYQVEVRKLVVPETVNLMQTAKETKQQSSFEAERYTCLVLLYIVILTILSEGDSINCDPPYLSPNLVYFFFLL